jgi:hypothetical protein
MGRLMNRPLSFGRIIPPLMLAIIGAVLAIFGPLFAAMMTVSEPTALANLKTFWLAWGFSARAGMFVGIAIFLIGAALIIWRITYRVSHSSHGRGLAPSEPAPTPRPQQRQPSNAMFEIGKMNNSLIQYSHTDRTDTFLRAGEMTDSEVRGCTARNPDKKDGD